MSANIYNFQYGMAEELCYVIIKLNEKDNFFVLLDKDRNVVNDSKIDSMDIKALILKEKYQMRKKRAIQYQNLRMKDSLSRNTIDKNILYSDLINFLHLKILK